MAEEDPELGFAPSDLTDGRKKYDWKTKYPDDAKKQITIEAIYVIAVLFFVPIALFVVWQGYPKSWLGLDDFRYTTFARYSYGWLGGMLGGSLYDLKWLYHTVAHGAWNMDRRLWRVVIPHLSGGHAFAVVVLMSSGIFKIFDVAELSRPSVVLSVGFLVGYFSDSAIGKLTEIANTLFGSSKKRYPDEKH